MKKRIIFSVLISALCLFLTNKLWLEFIPLPVSFDISGNGNYFITAAFNKKNNNDFVKVKDETIDLSLKNQTQNTVINVERAKHPKRFKLSFLNFNNSSDSITLSNIKLKDIKISDKDLYLFEAKNAKLKIENGKIILKPEKKKFEIIYTKPLKLSANIHFDIFYFIGIFLLTFLLVYKISDCLAKYESSTNFPKTEAIFLAIFFVFLFVPLSHIDNSEKSNTENRYLAKIKPLIVENKINNNFGKDFNEWFNDRFALRKEFIFFNNTFLCTVNNTCKTSVGTLYKKNNIVIDGSFYGTNSDNYKEDDKIVYTENLNKFNDYCSKNGIKLYILIVPRRGEFFDYNISSIKNMETDKAEEDIEYLKKHTNIKIIYPKEAMLEANKQTPVYFKTDTHWTKKGSYVGYYELLKTIQKDFPNTKILDEKSLKPYYDKRVQYWWNSDFTEGSLLMKLRLPKYINDKALDTDYLYYKNPNSKKLEAVAFKNSENMSAFDEEFFYPDGTNLKVMLIANSFGRNLVEFLPYSFKHTIRFYDNYRNLNFKTYEPLIKEYKPNIIIFNFQTNYIRKLGSIYKNNDESKEE